MKKYFILLISVGVFLQTATAQDCPVDLEEACPSNVDVDVTFPPTSGPDKALTSDKVIVKWAAVTETNPKGYVTKRNGSGCDGAWPIHISEMSIDGEPAICGEDMLQLIIQDHRLYNVKSEGYGILQNVFFPVGSTLNDLTSVLDRHGEINGGVFWQNEGSVLNGNECINKMSAYFPNRWVSQTGFDDNMCSTCDPCLNDGTTPSCFDPDNQHQLGFFMADSKLFFEKGGYHRDQQWRNMVDQTNQYNNPNDWPVECWFGTTEANPVHTTQYTDAKELRFSIRLYDKSENLWSPFSRIILTRHVFNHSSAVGLEIEDGQLIAHAIKGRQNGNTGDEKSGNNVMTRYDTEFVKHEKKSTQAVAQIGISQNPTSPYPNRQIALFGNPQVCGDNDEGNAFFPFIISPWLMRHPYNHTMNTNIDPTEEGIYSVTQKRANGMIGQTKFEVNSDGQALMFTPTGATFKWDYDVSGAYPQFCIDDISNRRSENERSWVTFMTSFTYNLQIPDGDELLNAQIFYERAKRYCEFSDCIPDKEIDLMPANESDGHRHVVTEAGEIKNVILFEGHPNTWDVDGPDEKVEWYRISGTASTVNGLWAEFSFYTTFMPSY